LYLLDTNVVSELRRTRPNENVIAWISGLPENSIYLSAVTIGEIQAGIEITRDQNPGKAEELEAWLQRVQSAFGILPMEAAAFREWARLMHRKSETLTEDAMIAATAKVNGLAVATRNVRDFRMLGVTLLNPFEPA
jgi:hypothetical protein